jgi:parallel beta-helix repeat protein
MPASVTKLPIYNVKDFGAIGDGVTDDTAAIQAALDAAGVTSGGVFVPEGTYKIASSINLLSNIVVAGVGPLTKLQASGMSAFRILAASSKNNFTVRDLALVGKRPNTTTPTQWKGTTVYTIGQYVHNDGNIYIADMNGTSAGSGGPTGTGSDIVDGTTRWDYVAPFWQPLEDAIYFTDCYRIRLQNLTCYNFHNDAIIIEYGTDHIIENCSVNNNNKDAIYLSGTERSIVSNNICRDSYVGIALGCSWYSTVEGNVCQDNTVSLSLSRDSRYNTVVGNSVQDIDLVQETTIGTLHGVTYPGSLNDYTYGAHFNTIVGNTVNGGLILARYSNNNIISDNVITDGAEMGVYLLGSARNVVRSNQIHNCAKVGAVSVSSILVNTFSGTGGALDPATIYSLDNLVLDNLVTDDRGVPLMWGIQLVVGSSGNVVSGNRLLGVAGTPKIADYGTNIILVNDSTEENMQGVVAALPAAGASFRNKKVVLQGGSGVADEAYVCLKKADGSYAWVQVASGPVVRTATGTTETLSSDDTVLQLSNAAAITVTLPTAAEMAGPGNKIFTVKDTLGATRDNTVPISFIAGSGTTLEFAYTIDAPFASLDWYLDGTVWRVK